MPSRDHDHLVTARWSSRLITHSITPWSSDRREAEIGRLLQRNWHDAIESAIKALYATSLSPEDTSAYIEACQNNLRDLDLKLYHTWWVPLLLDVLLLNILGVR